MIPGAFPQSPSSAGLNFGSALGGRSLSVLSGSKLNSPSWIRRRPSDTGRESIPTQAISPTPNLRRPGDTSCIVSCPPSTQRHVAGTTANVPEENLRPRCELFDGDPAVERSVNMGLPSTRSLSDLPRKPGASPNGHATQPHDEQEDSSPSRTTIKTARSVHDKLCKELKAKLTSKVSEGVIYVLRDMNGEGNYYKIGKTARDYKTRVEEHEKDCGYTPEVVYVSDQVIKNCGRLERLIHVDLDDHRLPWLCDRHQKAGERTSKLHDEWFAVTEEMAIETVKRWECFMQQQNPYAWDGNLSIVWRYLLETKSPAVQDIRSLSHEARRKQWTEILTPPTATDYIYAYQSYACNILKVVHGVALKTRLYLQMFFWQFLSILYGLSMLVLCRNLATFSAFAVVLGCASVTVLSKVKLLPSQKRPRTPARTP
ncbi:dna-binding protein [Stemphylium lycopersici]|uniref:Dna-binding protein n=1 Tax=Stemphylium lycopersici TaxID=183478 RepID=A0A364MSZ3_STELY|nr:dna-binding protein [Stemphylium lycopersici]RAR02385.1 dna-binding protein [Stemphylium lycopersici]RAR06227.1 dna-binding protein [Stemphylium lycopersici]